VEKAGKSRKLNMGVLLFTTGFNPFRSCLLYAQ